MPTNEEGEFELILGNRQLLSVFFVVVLLLGVFFTMGYVVGRNTMPEGTQMAAGKGAPIVVDPAVSDPPPLPSNERPSPTRAEPKADSPPPQTKEEPPPPPPAAKAEPVKPPPATPEPPKPEPPPAASGGTYLQVAATRKPEADLLAEVLTKKGYPTVVSPVPDSALVRVLVGPVGSDSLAKTREALVAAGFKPFPRAKL